MNRLKAWMLRITAFPVAASVALRLTLAVANAQQTIPSSGVTTVDQLGQVLCNVIGYFFWIVIVISVIMVLVAAFQYVTAGDDTEKTSKARKTITYAAIGIAVALLAESIPSIVSDFFSGASSNLQLDSSCSPESF